MDCWQLSVYCANDGLDVLAAALSMIGFEEMEIVDDIESIRDTLQETRDYWDYVDETELLQNGNEGACIRVYVSDDDEGILQTESVEAMVKRLQSIDADELGFSPATLHLQKKRILEEDWANAWREFYHPMKIGERLFLCPEWEDTQDLEGRVLMRMEPGLVFGTGEHQTTQLCLEALERNIQSGVRVLDLGCGSGILSVAALLLGAKEVLAVDVAADARATVYANAELNALSPDTISVEIGDYLQDKLMWQRIVENGPYDIVVSNIVADVLIATAPRLKSIMTDKALWIGSGIIEERLSDVEVAAENAGLKIENITKKDDWCAIEAHS